MDKKRIIAIVGKADGKEPDIQILDTDFSVIKSKGGTICIVCNITDKKN